MPSKDRLTFKSLKVLYADLEIQFDKMQGGYEKEIGDYTVEKDNLLKELKGLKIDIANLKSEVIGHRATGTKNVEHIVKIKKLKNLIISILFDRYDQNN